MSYKVLLADDSLTIQKVIKITLANEPYEIVVCKNELELLESAASGDAAIIFLDFTLSDTKSGYELASELGTICNSKILMMYGTFDTIEEDHLASAKVADKIVKPFDSTKFINICRTLIEEFDQSSSDLTELNYPSDANNEEVYPDQIEPSTEKNSMFDDVEDDEWVVESEASNPDDLFPEVIEAEVETDQSFPEPIEEVDQEEPIANKLESDLEDWGMSVPGVIGESDDQQELPPIIEVASQDDQQMAPQASDLEFPEEINPIEEPASIDETNEEKAMPDESDLEYPDMSDFSPSSQLISADELEDAPEVIDDVEISENNEEEEDNLIHLQNQIEEDNDDLWSVDDDSEIEINEEVRAQDIPSDFPSDVLDDNQALPPVMEEEKSQIQLEKVEELPAMEASQNIDHPLDDIAPLVSNESIPTMEVSNKPYIEETTSDSTSSTQVNSSDYDIDKIILELEQRIAPKIEENIRKMISSQVEEISQKIAWDVIPDVAENLIKEEIKKISDSVLQR